MSAISGGIWLEDEFPSPPRLNRKTICMCTGDEINSMMTWPGMLVFCLADGSGFFANSYYKRNASDTAWESTGAGLHYHTSDDDTGGGSLAKVMQANISTLLYDDKTHVPRASIFRQVVGASGSITDTAIGGNLKLITGGTTGSYANIYDVGRVDFGYNSSFVIKIESFNNTQIAVRFGFNPEPYSVADDTGAKYGLEFCDSAGVATNFYMFSSDGTQRGSSVTSISGIAPNNKGFRVEHEPSNIIRVFYDFLPKETRSQLVPGVGDTTPSGNLFGVGVKTNDVNSKTLDMYGYLAVGTRLKAGWS